MSQPRHIRERTPAPQFDPDIEKPGTDVVINWLGAVALIRKNWGIPAVGTVAGLLIAILYLHIVTPKYTITMQVTPVESKIGGLSGELSSLSGLASLAGGVGLPGNSGQVQLELYLAALDSPSIQGELLKDPRIDRTLFDLSWDDRAHTWHEPPSILRPLAHTIEYILGVPVLAWHPPDGGILHKILTRDLVIDYKKISPIATITYRNADPDFGRYLLLSLHNAADNRLRTRTVQRTSKYIDYLSEQLKIVTSEEQRAALITTLADEEKLRMAAMADISYSVDVLVPPTASPEPTDPYPLVVILAIMMIGAITGSIYVIFRNN